MRSFIFSQCRDRRMGVMWLELGALTQHVQESSGSVGAEWSETWAELRVAVVKLGVNNESGDGGSCFGIEVWMDTAKLAKMVKQDSETEEIWSEKVRCSSNMKPRFRAEWVVVSEELSILANWWKEAPKTSSICSSVSTELQLVTDRQTDTSTHAKRHMGKNCVKYIKLRQKL